jgi:hypothetical protein
LNAQIEDLDEEIISLKKDNIDLNKENIRFKGIIEETNDDYKKISTFEVTNDIEIFKLNYYIYLI